MAGKYPKVEKSIIKIVGLLEEKPGMQRQLLNSGYLPEAIEDEDSSFLKDYFYPGFRKMMFFSHARVDNRRLKKEVNQPIRIAGNSKAEHILVKDAEVFLFGADFIALFCITIQPEGEDQDIGRISSLLNLVRQFDTNVDDNTKWCEWIEQEILGGNKIRGRGVAVDDYSGSKFKLYTVIDLEENISENKRTKLLYDLGTSSPPGSSTDEQMPFSPHPDYYSKIMKNKLSVFNNWEALALLDTFTVIGYDILKSNVNFSTWDFTYFRIYLFRVFFKYNLYRYNSLMHSKEKIEHLRMRYEQFLNNFNTYPVSYNFLPNEIFQLIGKGLDVQLELKDFHNRITRISDAIKEKKQERMNLLLEFISVLGAMASVAVIPTIIEQLNIVSGWSAAIYYTFLVIVIIILLSILYRFIKPFRRKKLGPGRWLRKKR